MWNKLYRYRNGQSMADNPDVLSILGTQYIGRKVIKENTQHIKLRRRSTQVWIHVFTKGVSY